MQVTLHLFFLHKGLEQIFLLCVRLVQKDSSYLFQSYQLPETAYVQTLAQGLSAFMLKGMRQVQGRNPQFSIHLSNASRLWLGRTASLWILSKRFLVQSVV